MTARLTMCLLVAMCLSACAHAERRTDTAPPARPATSHHEMLWRNTRDTLHNAGPSYDIAALHRRLARAHLARSVPRAARYVAREAMSRVLPSEPRREDAAAQPQPRQAAPHPAPALRLAQLLEETHTPERQRKLLMLAERAAPHDVTTARRALAAAQSNNAPPTHLEHHIRVYVAAHIARAKKPYHNILRETWAAYPPTTPIGAELRAMFVAHAASALDQGSMRAARELASPELHVLARATVLAYLVVAHERRGEAAMADLLVRELRSLSPPRTSGEALVRAARVWLDAGVAWHVPELLDAPPDGYATIMSVIIDLLHERHNVPKLAHAMQRLIERQPTRQRQLEWIGTLAPQLLNHLTTKNDIIYKKISKKDARQSLGALYEISAAVYRHAGLGAALGWTYMIEDAEVRASLRASLYAVELRAAPPSEALLSEAAHQAAAHPNNTLHTALVLTYAARGRCDEALALFAGDVTGYIPNALALLIAPCARAGQLDAAHQLALRLPTPEQRAEALVWLVEVAPLITARGAP